MDLGAEVLKKLVENYIATVCFLIFLTKVKKLKEKNDGSLQSKWTEE